MDFIAIGYEAKCRVLIDSFRKRLCGFLETNQ
nr:MAG TPA: hypothetical protein [Caudoviricetes sp.]